MANRSLEMASIEVQLRLLLPAKVNEDDKLVEYDALLLDRFLDILQDLYWEDLRETVRVAGDEEDFAGVMKVRAGPALSI
ncbi:phosphoenolpyruvate carboxylase, housekeeping isozyme [Malus sylvestris]|uniref:phosphoenolpyruvate carboxylase, housekeeping isozyme n=1 Tax=Malus domestica TaxID=3750 RepID=UPI0010AA7795|nr:phosphoenolpyruvate carboxylase, housekeeping isozyme [Malus domestica]XP_050147489.1 phosphoenolpyruvate carboxylase, housekeeping isozyme [Malus sylvestris]